MFLEAVLYGISLAMDAMAVSVAMFSIRHTRSAIWQALAVSMVFALFQFIMPLVGFGCCTIIPVSAIEKIGKFIACALLLSIGGKMLFSKEECTVPQFGVLSVLSLALVTSIDALIVGVGFALTSNAHVFYYSIIIGIVTFFIALIGCFLGSVIGVHCLSKSIRIGGIVLVGIAVKQLF